MDRLVSNRTAPPRVATLVVCVLLIGAFGALPARVQATPPEQDGAAGARGPGSSAAPDVPKRPVPDYDGVPNRERPGHALVWVPRVLLWPLYAVFEYVVRRPLVWFVATLRIHRVPHDLVELFRFGPHDDVLLAPTFLIDFGFHPSVGLLLAYRHAGFDWLDLSSDVAFGGLDTLQGSLEMTAQPTESDWSFGLSVRAVERPDGQFYGLGSQAAEVNDARFSYVGYDATARVDHDHDDRFAIGLETGYRRRRFGTDVDEGQRAVPELLDPAQAPDATVDTLPPGWSGYDIWRTRLSGTMDTRPDLPHPLTGITGRVQVEVASDLTDRPRGGWWVRYGGAIAGHWDVSGVRHVLSLELDASVVDAVRGRVPFTEMPDLGGDGPMRGFHGGLLAGPSALASVLEYNWPVWTYLDGTLQIGVGNVFDGRFEGFALDRLRLSFAAGLAGIRRRKHLFELLVGFGTHTFREGASVESVRFTLGVRRAP